jgi:hydrogenase expression/formation protein HypC
MKLVRTTADGHGVAELEGTTCDVDLSLTPGAQLGDYVIVHAGFAIELLDREEADARLALFAEMAASYRSEDPPA